MKRYNIIISILCIALLLSFVFNIVYSNKLKVLNNKQKQIDTEFIGDLKILLTAIDYKGSDSNEFLREISATSGSLNALSKRTIYAIENPDIVTSIQYLNNLLTQPGIEKQYADLRSLSKYITNVLNNPKDDKPAVDLIRYLQQIEEKRINEK